MTPNIDIVKDFSRLQATVTSLGNTNVELVNKNMKLKEDNERLEGEVATLKKKIEQIENPKKYDDSLVDAIIGAGFPSIQYASGMTELGLANFTGNQWNENWSWNRNRLNELPRETLEELYADIKK